MAGSERIKIMKVLTKIIDEIDELRENEDYDYPAKKNLNQCRQKLWIMHQSILSAELDERIAITKAKTKSLAKIAQDLKAADERLNGVAEKISQAAKAVDKLVEMTKKSVELAATVAKLATTLKT
jgi:DNA-binding transcriptional regulator GbsR (MarR family)